jgi:hypothetical protein
VLLLNAAHQFQFQGLLLLIAAMAGWMLLQHSSRASCGHAKTSNGCRAFAVANIMLIIFCCQATRLRQIEAR